MNLLINNKKSIIVLVSLVTTNLITYYYTTKKDQTAAENIEVDPSLYADNCDITVKRLGGYDYIKPMLFVEKECESDKLINVKQSINNLIDEYKRVGTINSASVFLKEYTDNGWISINSDEKFMPGSLMKVPELIAFLKMEEAHPGALDKQLFFDKIDNTVDKHPKYISKSIAVGQSYSVRELLKYMIMYSDNNATSLLFKNMDIPTFKRVFTDVGLQAPDLTAQNYPITAKDYSIFMRILYNSSYLSEKNSELATELLSKCNFTQGLVSALPSTVKVAHKFGEAGDPNEKQLSESAIVYLANNPYILTVMVKGKDLDKLPEIIKQISATTYKDMSTTVKPTS